MSSSRSEFGERFLLPLLRSQSVHVGAPLGIAGFKTLFARSIDKPLAESIVAARRVVASELVVSPSELPIVQALEEEAWALAVAVHDMLFLLHPAARSIADRKLAGLVGDALQLAKLPEAVGYKHLIARHTIVHPIPTLSREDVRVNYWMGQREFLGSEPPRRLLSWPKVRRVREERWHTSCFEAASNHGLASSVLAALLEASPLTDLLHPLRDGLPFSLARHATTLREPIVCRLVVYHYLSLGLSLVGPLIAREAITALQEQSRTEAAFLCAFLSHLNLCCAPGLLPPSAQANSRSEVPRHSTDPSLDDFYALFAALCHVAPELALPADVCSPHTLRSVTSYAESCLSKLAIARVPELGALLTRVCGPTTSAAMATCD